MSEEQRAGYCPNKKCELFNQYQGDSGLEEDEKFTCTFCKRIIGKVK